MRLQDYMASTGRTVGRSESVHRQSSRLNSQATGKSRRQKRGKVKLRRIKSVQCDLQDLRRVFVFELEPIENRSIYASAQHQNHESIHPTQIPSDGHARLTGEADSTTILDLEPIPSVADTRPAVLTTEPEETSIYIEADDSSDAASIITLEGSCFTELTGVHRLGAEFEHGRRYHGHHAGLYFQPDDERAQERMDLGHHMYVHLMDRKLYFAPIGNEDQRVLDVGTGTGLWAIDFADEHPHSWVEGVDLSAVQPQWVPPNVHFYIDDASTLDLYGDDMDFIHARGLNGCFDKWDEFYESVLKTLEPGGWFEQVEHSIEISSQERSPPPVDDPIPKLQDILSDASKITGRRFDVHADLHESLERAGFTEVCSHVIHCPIGPWARDKNLKDCGCYALEYWSEFLEDMFLALMTRFLEWDAQEARAFLATVRKQFLVPKRYLYFNIVVAYGRRPP
ncbi:hypothetical protein H2200_008444 [Cladophialophora chaetospira]|uniref:S-adenosyl-L-methionine-dependent methyltransferase n=1 Tax=Cladophialophora chaetospira TaxID=386627 RepID=A0AA38X698_9EURO|nr:hypothetical protein H2200_008444 [Cladophialophora chaetospira]